MGEAGVQTDRNSSSCTSSRGNGNNGHGMISARRFRDDSFYEEIISKYESMANTINKLETVIEQQQRQLQLQLQLLQELPNKRSRRSHEEADLETGGGGGRRRNKKDEEGVGRDIPKGYEILAGGDLLTAWISYFVGDGGSKPGKELTGSDLPRNLSSTFCMYKKLMKAIVQEAKDQGIWDKLGEPTDAVSAWRMLRTMELDSVVPKLTNNNRSRSLGELRWITLATT